MSPSLAMARRGLLIGALLLAAGCAHKPPPPLYLWEDFPKMQYDTLLAHGGSTPEQIEAMQEQAEKARAAGAALPPGFRAHLGMLKLAAGDVDQAREHLLAEKVAFPESAPYMNQLLRRLEAPSKKGAPA